MSDYSFLDALSDGIIIDRDYTIIFANRPILAQCRMTPGEIAEGQKCYQLLHGCPIPWAEICLEKKPCPHDIVFQSGLGLHAAHHYICPEGNKKNAVITASPLVNEKDEIDRLLLIMRDVTAAELMREKAERDADDLRRILSTTDDLLSFIDTNYIYRTVNDAYCRTFNKKREEIEGHSAIELLGVEHFESKTREVFARCLHGEEVREEVLFNIPGLQRRHMDVAYYPFFEASGRVAGIVVNARDITRRKLAEERLSNFAERKDALYNLTLSFLEARSPEEIGAIALTHLRRLIPCAGCCIVLFDPREEIAISLAGNADITPPLFRENFPILQCGGCMSKLRSGGFVLLSDQTPHELHPCIHRDRILIDGIRVHVTFPLRAEGDFIGVLAIFHDKESCFSADHCEIAREIAAPVAASLHKSRLHEALALHSGKLQEMTLRMAEIEDNERSRLSRQLHDEAGQRLSALGLNLNTLHNDDVIREYPELRLRLDDCISLVEQITEQTRNVMADLRPPVLDDYGLGPALRWYCKKVSRRGNLSVVYSEETIPPLPRPLENTLFSIAREAISNAVNHGRPKQITLCLRKTETGILLRVEDDGRGFTEHQPCPQDQEQRWGLISMRERIAALGGRFEIQTLPGQGAIVIAEVPL